MARKPRKVKVQGDGTIRVNVGEIELPKSVAFSPILNSEAEKVAMAMPVEETGSYEVVFSLKTNEQTLSRKLTFTGKLSSLKDYLKKEQERYLQKTKYIAVGYRASKDGNIVVEEN